MIFTPFERVQLRVDPRQTGTVTRWLTKNWDARRGVRVHWDNGQLEDLRAGEIEPIEADHG